MRVHLSWPTIAADPSLRVWRVYGNPDREVDVKGRLIVEVPGTENEATVEVDEGWWRFRIVGVSRVETETAWETALAVIDGDFTARGPDDVPPTPSGVGAGAVGDGLLVAVVDAPDPLTRPHKLQLIGAPAADVTDPAFGHLLAEHVQGPADLQGADAPTLASPAVALSGQGRSDTRKLFVRPLSGEGTPGTAVERAIESHERAQVDRNVLAVIDKTAGTYSGFAAPGATDAWEAAATYGFRARKLPTWGAWTSDFGTWGSGGILDGASGRYAADLRIPTNEFDLGAATLFQLDLYHEAHRRDAELPAWGEGELLPAWPGEERDLRGTPESPGWFAREVTWGSSPRQPIRSACFEYVAGNASPLDTSESSWRRYVPGLWIRARYVRVRLRLAEPFPWFRVATGSVHVATLRPRTWQSGSGSPEAAVAGPFGAVYVRTDVSPYALFLKTTATGNTGWIEVARTSDLSTFLEAGDDAALLGSGAATAGWVLTADGAGGADFAAGGGTPDADATTKGKVQLAGDLGGTAASPAIANDAVTNAKAANMATQTIKGRTTAGTGDPEDLTAAQAAAILPAFTGDSGAGGAKGSVPAPAAGDGAAKLSLLASGVFGIPRGTFLRIVQYSGNVSGTHTPNASATSMAVLVIGAGAGGGGADSTGVGGGGGAGGWAVKWYGGPTLSTYAYQGRAGGTGGAAGNNAGNAPAGATTFDSVSVPASNGGGSMATGTAPAIGVGGAATALPSGGDENHKGAGGDHGYRLAAAFLMGGKGAASKCGDGGRASPAFGSDGEAAEVHGAGGGGATAAGGTDRAGGAGGDSLIVIVEFY